MKAQDLMTPDVITVLPDMPVVAVARLLSDRGISAVPVADAKRRVVGVVSESDLLRAVAGETQKDMGFLSTLFSDPHRLAAEYAKTHGRTAKDVMTTQLISVAPGASAMEIAQLMASKGIHRVLVMDGERLLGIVSRADLLRAILSPSATTEARSDEDIRRTLLDELRRLPWINTHFVTVVVKDGVATLYGVVGSDEISRGLEAAAASVPGVQRVDNRTEVGATTLYGLS